MFHLGSYQPVLLALAGVLLLAGLFVAACRRSLSNYSRKSLLAGLPVSSQRRFEDSLGEDDEYLVSLERVELGLRGWVVFCLAIGRVFAIDAALAAQDPAARMADLSAQTWLLALAVLVLEIGVLVSFFLSFVPWIIGQTCPEAWLRRFLGAIERVHVLVGPLRWMGERFGRYAEIFRLGKPRSNADIVEEEILSAAEEGGREGVLDSQDIDMIESIIAFGDVEVSEVMTPRTEMICIDLDDPLERNLKIVVESGFSRIPVYRNRKDNVTGILYAKDLLKQLYRRQEIDLERLVRKPYYVSFEMKIDELLQEFKAHHLHIAVVRDEFGGTEGLITIEDILEEIVGDIGDEFEPEAPEPIERIDEGLIDVDAGLHIDELNEELGLGLPESESYDTIGGFVFARMGRVPAIGDVFEYQGLRFEVLLSDERRILRLRLHLEPTPSEESRGGRA